MLHRIPGENHLGFVGDDARGLRRGFKGEGVFPRPERNLLDCGDGVIFIQQQRGLAPLGGVHHDGDGNALALIGVGGYGNAAHLRIPAQGGGKAQGVHRHAPGGQGGGIHGGEQIVADNGYAAVGIRGKQRRRQGQRAVQIAGGGIRLGGDA